MMRKLLVLSFLATIFSSAWADVPLSTCSQYLNYSDSSFYSMIASGGAAATTAAQALESCVSDNACASINGLDNCSLTLANRLFASEYYAMNSSSSGGFGASAPSTAQPPQATNSANTNNNANNKPSTNKNDNSVHWF